MRRADPAVLVVLGGIAAALHVGKLPPALPILRDSLGISLLEAGFLLSVVQLAGMALGLAAGLLADGLGLRRTMAGGLLILSAAGAAGGWATSAEVLLLLRAGEGLGFLLASMPAPALIRRLVEPDRLHAMLGWWGAYMPLGTAAALLFSPFVIAAAGWEVLWWGLAALSLAAALSLWLVLPPSCDVRQGPAQASALERVRSTLAARGPWLAALTFGLYSAQWLAVIGFLPSIYAQAGIAGGSAAIATASVAGVNMVGNVASGGLLQRGWPARTLLTVGLGTMALGAAVAFAPLPQLLPEDGAAVIRFAGMLLFSGVGGMVPGTLFSMAVRIAPGPGTLATTVGWMQQWSSIGQFSGPPLVAWVASRTGGWDWVWLVTGSFAVLGIFLARLLAPRPGEGVAA
jgi:CP family cyanate transporter-like MFS transporter